MECYYLHNFGFVKFVTLTFLSINMPWFSYPNAVHESFAVDSYCISKSSDVDVLVISPKSFDNVSWMPKCSVFFADFIPASNMSLGVSRSYWALTIL